MRARSPATPKQSPAITAAATNRRRWLLPVFLLLVSFVAGGLLLTWNSPRDRTALSKLVAASRLHEAEQFLEQHPDLVQRDGQGAYLSAIVYRRLEQEQPFLASIRFAERKGVPRSDLDLQKFLVQVQAGAVGASEIPQRLGAGITEEQQEDVFDAMTRGCLRTYQVRAAHDLIDRWLKVRPNSLAAQLHRGRAWQLSEDLSEATEAFERVLQQVPQHYEATVELATLLLVRNELPRAQQLLSALVARDPQDLRANVLLAQCERREGKGAAALARLEALPLETASPADRAQVLKLLGQLRFDAEKYAAAVVDLRAALALSPRDAELHQTLASALAATGDADGATEQRAAAQQLQAAQERLLQALRAVRKNPTDPEARFEQAAALNEAQSPAAAITALRALLVDHPDHAAAKALYDQLVRSRTANDGS